jgi:hypothetical protein
VLELPPEEGECGGCGIVVEGIIAEVGPPRGSGGGGIVLEPLAGFWATPNSRGFQRFNTKSTSGGRKSSGGTRTSEDEEVIRMNPSESGEWTRASEDEAEARRSESEVDERAPNRATR